MAGHGHDRRRLSRNDVDAKIAQRLYVAGRPPTGSIQRMVMQMHIRLPPVTTKGGGATLLVLVPVRIAVPAAGQK